MSSSIDSENGSKNEPRDISSFEHAGNLIHHVEVDSAESLKNFVSKCSKEGRRIISSKPFRLPEKPAHRIDYFLTLQAQNVIEHFRPDQVISVEAGISIKKLQGLLAEQKQWFPIYTHDEEMSLLEYINSGSSGPLEHGFGEARDLVLGMMVVLGSGQFIKCGGKVVKNVTGYDMPKLFAGSHGTLAIPFSAHLRLFARPETSSSIVFDFATIEGAMVVARKLRRSGLPLSCLEMFKSNLFSLFETTLSQALAESVGTVSLAVEIHGIKSVVEELEKETMALASESLAKRVLNEADARQLWQYLAKPYAKAGNNWVEISASLAVIEALLNELQNETSYGWTVRCGRNKASLFSSKDIYAHIVELANKVLAPSRERIVIAHSDSSYAWKVCALPAQDAVLSELKHRLKREFDPSDILNPLAEL